MASTKMLDFQWLVLMGIQLHESKMAYFRFWCVLKLWIIRNSHVITGVD